MHAAVQK